MKVTGIRPVSCDTALELAVAEVVAGFPSPATDYTGDTIDLNKELIKHPASTFFAWAKGESMTGADIADGDLLIIDRAVEPADGDIAVCYLDGAFTLKHIHKGKDCLWLLPDNPNNPLFKPIKVSAENDCIIWGRLMYSIRPR